MQARRVVVTGLGLLCGVGNTAPEVWAGLMAARAAWRRSRHSISPATRSRLAAEVKNFDVLKFVEKKESRKMGRFIHFALAAAQEAMEHSGLVVTPEISDRFGVHIGSGIGGFDIIEREHTAMMEGRSAQDLAVLYSGDDREPCRRPRQHQVQGPRPERGHRDRLYLQRALHRRPPSRIIQRGDADAMIAGGTEAAITPIGRRRFCRDARTLRAQRRSHAPPAGPFDKDRDGFVVGEGAGILIMEELEFAKARGAMILAEVIGYGMSADAFHMTGMAPEGEGLLSRDERRAEGCRRLTGRGRLRERACDEHAARRCAGVPRRSKMSSVSAPKNHTLLVSYHQVDDRASARRRGRAGGGYHHHGHAEPDRSADDEPGERRPRSAG